MTVTEAQELFAQDIPGITLEQTQHTMVCLDALVDLWIGNIQQESVQATQPQQQTAA